MHTFILVDFKASESAGKVLPSMLLMFAFRLSTSPANPDKQMTSTLTTSDVLALFLG